MLKRILFIVGVIVLLLVLAGAGFSVYTVRRSFPQTEGDLTIPGLDGPVTVLRDPMGIPHIYTPSEHDLFLAQGFVHAQDRFWQMDFYRHVAGGRLAELFGESQLEADRFLRTLGFEQVVTAEYPLLDEPTRAMLDAYAEGVNAYLDRYGAGGALSLEYSVLWLTNRDYRPSPWRPEDTLLFAKVMAYSLSGNLDQEVSRFAMLAQLSRAEVDRLYPPYPVDEKPVIVSDPPAPGTGPPAAEGEAAATTPALGAAPRTLHTGETAAAVAVPTDPGDPALATLRRQIAAVDDLLAPIRQGLGSNSWAVAGTLTDTGKPFLANDTHLAAQMPSIWYEVGLHQQAAGGADGAGDAAGGADGDRRFEVVGFSFPGAPGVIIGHNEHLAWGCTNLPADVQDLYIEKLDPADPDRYQVDGHWTQVDVRTEELKVAGGPSETLTVRSTHHGPIVSDSYEPLSDAVAAHASGGDTGSTSAADDPTAPLPEAYALSLRWTALEPSTLMQAVRQIDLAATLAEFREAARLWDVPSQNLLFASNSGPHGHIGYQAPGKIPIRGAGDGRYPVPGWSGTYEWIGYVPFEALPWAQDPPSGYIVTANNAVTVGGTLPDEVVASSSGGATATTDEGVRAPTAVPVERDTPYLAYDWAYGDRAARIVELIEQAEGPLTLAHMQHWQADTYDANAAVLVPILLDLDLTGRGADDGVDGADLERARDRLRDWDFQTTTDSAPAVLFETVWADLLERTFADDLPADLSPHGGGQWFLVVRDLLDDPASPWWDDRTTPGVVEDRDAILTRAFVAAVEDLRDDQGKDEELWRWGERHTVTFRNLSLGSSGIWAIERIFNRGPYDVAGTTDAVDANSWSARRPPADDDTGETGERSYEVRVLPALRMIVDLAHLDQSWSTHTTGQSGHAFSEHYTDMVDLWLDVDYHPMYWERETLETLDGTERLELAP